MAPPPVARKEQRATRGSSVIRYLGDSRLEILAGCHGVAHVEPHRLADAHCFADRDRAAFLVDTKDASHQEVTALVLGLVLVDHQPGKHALRGELLFALAQLGELRL